MGTPQSKVIIIGGGPAGLMAAEQLLAGGAQVDLYDAMPTVGRKFLMAGKGGLNITHSEPADRFLARFGKHQAEIAPMLVDFAAEALRAWIHELGVETFVGTSGRVFPAEMKAAPLLRAWLRRLRAAGLTLHMRHRWLGWEGTNLRFATPGGDITTSADAVVLAMGGGSWPKLGSDGAWTRILQDRGVEIAPLQPSNCGFDVSWSSYFRDHYAGQPVKPVVARFGDVKRQGEFVVTDPGVEGGLIYALSAPARDAIAATGKAVIHLDLAPARDHKKLLQELSRPRGKNSLSNYLRKYAGLDGVKAGLLREVLAPADFDNAERLVTAIKAFPLTLTAPRPLAEVISTAGGVRFSGLDDNLMITGQPGVFCAGEMLDWEAPTGGYLLTACFASGRKAGQGALSWLKSRP